MLLHLSVAENQKLWFQLVSSLDFLAFKFECQGQGRHLRGWKRDQEKQFPWKLDSDSSIVGRQVQYRQNFLNQDLLESTPVLLEALKTLWGSKNVWFYDHELFRKLYPNTTSTGFHQDTGCELF